MNKKRYAAVVGALEKIDRTGIAPELSGPIGRFFRAYAQHRLGVAKLAIDMGMSPAKDGTLLGGASGIATLRFLDDVATWDETATEFGVLYHVSVLCDEFLSPITLRLWSSTGAGAEGIHNLTSLRLRDQGVQLQGNFKWKPPSVLVPNRATFQVVAVPDSPQWLGAYYLRYVGEDVGIDPHPLSYVPIATSGSRMFAALRIVVGRAKHPNVISVPFATKEGAFELTVRTNAAVTNAANPPAAEHCARTWLIAREPDDSDWVVLDWCEATKGDLLAHSVTWGSYLRTLSPAASIPTDDRIAQQTTANLCQIGLAGPLHGGPLSPPPRHPADPLATRIAEEMRFPNKRVGVRVLGG